MTLGSVAKWGVGVGAALGACGALLYGAVHAQAPEAPPSAAEVASLHEDVKRLVEKLEQFDRRLSYMEGAAGQPPPRR